MKPTWSGGKSLYSLSQYNRRIGLPSILGTSMLISLLIGLSLYLGFDITGTALNIVALALLLFMSVDALLMLANFLIMNYLFDRVLEDYSRRGLPYASLTGIEALKDSSARETRYSIILVVSALASLLMYLLGDISLQIMFIYTAVGLSFITLGFSVIKRKYVLDPDEMLKLYEPNVFPIVMKIDVFLETFMDPLNRLRFDEYKRELAGYLKEGLAVGDALGKICFLLYQNLQGAIGRENLRRELSELVKNDEFVNKLESHQVFDFDRLKIILAKSKRLIPEFTRLLDRLFINTLDNLPDLKDSSVFIDAEASWEKRRGQLCKAFILLYNNQSDKAKTLTVNYSAPAFAPSSAEVVVTLPPRDFDLPSEDVLPVYSEGEKDVVGLASMIMDNVRIVWFSFEVKENGLKPVSVTVRDKDSGQTLFGRKIGRAHV